MKSIERDAQGALDRYVALTGDRPAAPDDPAIRRFLAGYETLADREHSVGANPPASRRRRR